MSPRDAARAAVVALARLVFGPPHPGRPLPVPGKVLVIRTDPRVGNVLLTVPLLRALRRGLPGATVVFLCAPRQAALVSGLPYVDRIEPFAKKDFFRRPWVICGLLLRLRQERFDLVIEAGHWHAFSLTASLLARAVGGRATLGSDRGPAGRLLDHVVSPPPGTVQDAEVKLALLGPLGIEPAGSLPETLLGSDPASASEAKALIRALGLREGKVLLLNPGARVADRRAPAELWGEALQRLASSLDLDGLVLWGPGEEAIAREVVQASRGKARLAPATDLRQLAALCRAAALVVTNDTGPMHLSVACGAPTVAVFLVSDPERWGHPSARFAAVSAGDGAMGIETAAQRLLAVDAFGASG